MISRIAPQMFYLISRILNAGQQNEMIQWYVAIPHTSHDTIVIMLEDVTIIDENVKNIRIILIFLTHHPFLNHVSILDRCVNIDSCFPTRSQILSSISFLINNNENLQGTSNICLVCSFIVLYLCCFCFCSILFTVHVLCPLFVAMVFIFLT